MVPSYITLLLFHKNMEQSQLIRYLNIEIADQVSARQKNVSEQQNNEFANADGFVNRVIKIPVCYHPALAEDLEATAELIGITVNGLITLHSETIYRVYALGFQPGFAFLGTLPQALTLPRLETPRMKVPAGSVAIAERQTAVYPAATPGGWRILGRTPLPMFLPDKSPPVRIQANQYVQFVPIELTEYEQLVLQLKQ
jgi:inhibitor of KinA